MEWNGINYAHQNPLNLCGDLECALTSTGKTYQPDPHQIVLGSEQTVTRLSWSKGYIHTFICFKLISVQTLQIVLSNQCYFVN